MERTSQFTVLQATAAIVSMAVLLWSLGFSAIHFAEAANVTTLSDTISDSAPSVGANHTITFSTPDGVDNNETIVIDFTDGPFDDNTVDFEDVDVSIEGIGDVSVDAACSGASTSAAFSGDILTITFCSGAGASIAANGTTTIEIGTNATFGVAGASQLTNPSTGSYQIGIQAGNQDSGETRVAIVNTVTVTASVDTVFTFNVAGVAAGQTVNGTTTGGATDATNIPFGELDANVASTAAQDLTVTTNARNGFVVTVVADGQLDSTIGADIDGFANGNYNASPIAWTSPSGSLGSEETYGHWGITSDDTDHFAATETYVSASTSPVSVFTHDGPVNGTGAGQGVTRVGYTVETSPLQEAAEDYTAILTYIATPIF